MPQRVYIANGTIRENLTLGYKPSAFTEEEIWEAIKLANLHDFISNLPQQLDSILFENGRNLSGGQQQRIGLARALMSKPKLLILDEATSSLDNESEIVISDAILQLDSSITVITIAHRLSTILRNDLLVYLESGKILATGTINELRLKLPNFDNQLKIIYENLKSC